jgi:PAS domain S-box-containing protein
MVNQVERKTALMWLRVLLLVVLGGVIEIQLGWDALKTGDYIIFGCFAVWVNAGIFMPKRFFRKDWALAVIFIADTVFSIFLIRLLDNFSGDFFLVYFIAIFLAVLARTMVGSAGVSVLAIFLYGILQYLRSGQFVPMDSTKLMLLPFLFVASVLAGFLAEETSKEIDEKKRLRNVSNILAEKVDLATSKLVESNRNMKALLEYHKRILSSVQTGIIVVHQDGKIRTFNEYASKITGFLAETLEGQPLESFPHSLDSMVQVIQRTMKEARAFSIEDMEITTSRGEKIPVSIQTAVMRAEDGPVLGTIVTFRDVSLLRQMETQLSRAERLSALGEMAAGVAHEIKNPLNAIQGFSQRLASKIDDPNLKKYAETIVREVQRLDTTINDVLEYSRTAKPVKQPTDLHALLEETLQYVAEKMEKSNIKLERKYDPNFPLVPMDYNKIKQVFLNMVLNAIHAMPQGGTLTFQTSVQQGLRDGDSSNPSDWVSHIFLNQKMAVVSIQDTGCGIPKENIPKLFHPFFTTKTTGTGLGLSICHKIVEAHGGTITVDSKEGLGTTFSIQFPLED